MINKLMSLLLFSVCNLATVQTVEKVNVIKGNNMSNFEKNNSEEACPIPSTSEEIGKINTSSLKIILQSETNFILLDARTSKWDDGKRIPGALSLTSEDSIEKFNSLIPQKNSLVIVYCSNLQCGASERLAKRLIESGYTCILKYPEGIEEWINSGNPITENK